MVLAWVFWKFSVYLSGLPLLSGPPPPLLFFFPRLCLSRTSSSRWGETSSSSWQVAAGQLLTGPLRPHSQSGSLTSPSTADGAASMAWGAPGGALAARRRCSQSRGGTSGKGWPAQSGCPSQPAVTHQGLTVIENGFCCAGLLQGMSVGFWGSGGTWSAALACFLIVLPGPRVGGNFQNTHSSRENPRSQERKRAGRRQRPGAPEQWKPLEEPEEGGCPEWSPGSQTCPGAAAS